MRYAADPNDGAWQSECHGRDSNLRHFFCRFLAVHKEMFYGGLPSMSSIEDEKSKKFQQLIEEDDQEDQGG